MLQKIKTPRQRKKLYLSLVEEIEKTEELNNIDLYDHEIGMCAAIGKRLYHSAISEPINAKNLPELNISKPDYMPGGFWADKNAEGYKLRSTILCLAAELCDDKAFQRSLKS
jgi:hypothetical protein